MNPPLFMKTKFIGLAFLLMILQSAEARVVTLVVTNAETREVQIALGEVAELLGWSAYQAYPNFSSAPFRLVVSKDGADINLFIPPSMTVINAGFQAYAGIPARHLIAGPATIRMSGVGGGTGPNYCTFNISPETFPPDKTFILPAGTNQVTISLECSTNLVNWLTATNGVYGSPTEAKFFRIKAQTLN